MSPRRVVLLYWFAIAIAAAAPACKPDKPPPTRPAGEAAKPTPTKPGAAEAEIARVLDDWHGAAAKADEARYFAHFTPAAVFLGTDGKERWSVPEFRAYAHPFFARGQAWTFRATRRSIAVVGDVAWFDEDLDTPNLGPARGTGVLVREDRLPWRIAQYSLSVPIPNERFKDVKALLSEGPAR